MKISEKQIFKLMNISREYQKVIEKNPEPSLDWDYCRIENLLADIIDQQSEILKEVK